MQFTITSWHFKSVEYWLSHNAFTTMASPPQWSREHDRNLALFAPPKQIVFGNVSEEEYTAVYSRVMQGRLAQVKQWVATHQQEHIILLCACPDGRFCHRLLIAKLLRWLQCEELPLAAHEQMIK